MNAKATILDGSLRLYDRLERLGSMELATKKDLLQLSFIAELLYHDCYHGLFTTRQKQVLSESFNWIVASNKSIPFYRADNNLYKNFGGKQNITDYQVIEDKLILSITDVYVDNLIVAINSFILAANKYAGLHLQLQHTLLDIIQFINGLTTCCGKKVCN